jgi:hypothetical protein
MLMLYYPLLLCYISQSSCKELQAVGADELVQLVPDFQGIFEEISVPAYTTLL